MNRPYPFNELQQAISSARSFLVAFPQKASFDHVAASLSLYLSLNKIGKSVSLFSPEPMRVEFSHLVGVDRVANKLVGGDTVITLDYPIANIDKVSYNDDGGKLNLVVKVKPESAPLSQNQVIFNQGGGGSYDLVFLVGVNEQADLGQLPKENKDLLTARPVVNINNLASSLGTLSFVDPQASSCSEIIANLIKTLGLPIDKDIGTNLLLGLKNATQDFQSPKVGPLTFEMAAFSSGAGGRKEPAVVRPRPVMEKPKKKKPSPDWFEPKIYRGTSIS
jgi:nanoRNase/pAp phosphatase (c-di-AMP/oligoRNAs hydrolase)